MADPGINPPNLAAVQEVAAGILRVASTVTVDTAEIWVDDVRLTDPVNQVGTALALDARLAASDVGDLRLAYTRRGGQFRQLGDDPTYQTTSDFQAGGTVRMERFLPPSLGVFAPVTVAYTRSSTTPELLRGTDIVATDLEGLRTPESWNATVSLAVRRSARGSGWVTRGFVDPLSLSATLTDGAARTELSNSTTKSMNLGAVYNLALNSRGFKLPFGFVDGLPDWLSDSEAGEGLKGARLSLVPRSIRWSSRLARTQSEYTTYAVPIFRAGDDALRPVLNESHTWVNSAGLTLQPLGMLTMSGDLTSTRDLRRYPDSTSIGRLANASRKSLLGLDVGVERLRTFTSQLSLSPRINAWLRPRLTSGSIFSINRDLASRDPVRVEGDSAGAFLLPQTFNNSRTRELAAAVEPSVLVRRIFGDSSVVTKALSRIRTLDLSTRTTRTSTFDLATFKPSLGYQLALGGTEDFLRQDGEIARGANEVITNQVSAGANLPLGIQASVSYSLVRTFQYTRVDQDFLRTRIRAKEWPVGNVRWNGSFTGGPISILGLGTTFRKVEGTTVVPRIDGGRAGVSLNRSTSVMPDLNIGFRNGVAATLGYALTNQTTQNNGNTTEVDLTTLTGSVNYAFPLPRSISPRGRLVRTALSVLDSRSSSCLQRSGEEDCNTITDIRRQELRASLDTDVSRLLQGGLQLSYAINDARHIDRRTSQIIISLNFSLSLFAGDFR